MASPSPRVVVALTYSQCTSHRISLREIDAPKEAEFPQLSWCEFGTVTRQPGQLALVCLRDAKALVQGRVTLPKLSLGDGGRFGHPAIVTGTVVLGNGAACFFDLGSQHRLSTSNFRFKAFAIGGSLGVPFVLSCIGKLLSEPTEFSF